MRKLLTITLIISAAICSFWSCSHLFEDDPEPSILNKTPTSASADGVRPEGLTQDQANEYDNIENANGHKHDVNMSHLLTEWSCTNGNFYQYVIFAYDPNEISMGFVFYGSFDNTGKGKTPEEAKEEARKKAEEARDAWGTYDENGDFSGDMGICDATDCITGYAIIEDMEKITISLMSVNDPPESAKNIIGAFYLSPSGKLIARPAGTVNGTAVEKTGFKWEK